MIRFMTSLVALWILAMFWLIFFAIAHVKAEGLRHDHAGRFHSPRIERARHARPTARHVAPKFDDECRPPLAVVGDQYASESGAQGEADKAWMQTARWQWGERYMARERAAGAHYECGRSSVGSLAGQVFYRCRLTARPCPPLPTGGGSK